MSLPKIEGLELLDVIGNGSCGTVYRGVVTETKAACAVKVFSSMAINRKLLSIAMKGLQQMPAHPGLLKVYAYDFDGPVHYVATSLVGVKVENEKGKTVWETPTLEALCGTASKEDAWKYIHEICDSIAWLHKHNLVHCNLKPRNVLMEDDHTSITKISDILQGWIGGIYHFEATDHFLYLSPEQADHPEALTTHGTSWDVYSFGVLSYKLLTGKYPRAQKDFDEQMEHQKLSKTASIHALDNIAIIRAVRQQLDVEWPQKVAHKWEEKRRAIIDRCLVIDPKVRWPDLREVLREFEKIEAEKLLVEAREKIQSEKKRQARKVLLFRSASVILGFAFVAAAVFGVIYGVATQRRAKTAEDSLSKMDSQMKTEVANRENKLGDLTKRLSQAHEEKKLADANLQMSHAAVDQFLTQLLQIPTGIGLEAEISKKPINDALAFCEGERLLLQEKEELLPERARNYFNTALLLMRKQQRTEAYEWFEKARVALIELLQKEPKHVDRARRQALLGRTCRWLGTLKTDAGQRSEALALFKQAVTSLTTALETDPQNRSTRYECAIAWYELGKRSRRDEQLEASSEALRKATEIMDVKILSEGLTPLEQYLLTRTKMEAALALRDQDKVDDSMKLLFEAMLEMVKLVERSAPFNQEQALTLAEAYIEFGEIVAGKLGAADSRDAQNEALTLLTELVRLHPQWTDARFLLARNYGDIAALERDKGNTVEAINKQTLAVKTLEELVKETPDNLLFVAERTRQKGMHAQLLCDSGKPKDAITLLKEPVDNFEALLKQKDPTLDKLDRKNYGVMLAQLQGIVGQGASQAKDSALAKDAFTKASALWTVLQSSNSNDEVIVSGLKWSKEQLGKIK
ncbi:hypothetical protein BH11VER1_BH11VER1_23480 [soil metagenome]